jgi:hypothetical protein
MATLSWMVIIKVRKGAPTDAQAILVPLCLGPTATFHTGIVGVTTHTLVRTTRATEVLCARRPTWPRMRTANPIASPVARKALIASKILTKLTVPAGSGNGTSLAQMEVVTKVVCQVVENE